jgi:hypothetical protein
MRTVTNCYGSKIATGAIRNAVPKQYRNSETVVQTFCYACARMRTLWKVPSTVSQLFRRGSEGGRRD